MLNLSEEKWEKAREKKIQFSISFEKVGFPNELATTTHCFMYVIR